MNTRAAHLALGGAFARLTYHRRDVVTSVMPDIETQLQGLLLQKKWGA